MTGSADVAGRRVTISGMGQVGSRLAVRLSAEGALLTVTDVNPAKRDLALQLGAAWIAPGEEHLVPADVFVPAGIGVLLTDEIIDALDARAVCGPANNPLADHSGAERLARRGVPDQPLERANELRALLAERIAGLKPRDGTDFGTTEQWRHYNSLYFPYVAGVRAYAQNATAAGLDPVARQAWQWFVTEVPQRSLHNWQNAAARVIAADLRGGRVATVG